MSTRKTANVRLSHAQLIAPCGMNCAICIAFLRERAPCPGCLGDDSGKPKHCVLCAIKHCAENKSVSYCFECDTFPCARIRQLDKRYRTKYGMSMIENLERLHEVGLEAFVAGEIDRWQCEGCGRSICVHRTSCLYCGRNRPAN